jgi:hypothetical protein
MTKSATRLASSSDGPFTVFRGRQCLCACRPSLNSNPIPDFIAFDGWSFNPEWPPLIPGQSILQTEAEKLAGGKKLSLIAQEILNAIAPDYIERKAREGKPDAYKPTEKELRNPRTSI